MALHFEVRTEGRSHSEETSGSTRAQMKRLAATYITPKAAIAVIKQMRRTPRTTRMMKTRGQPSGGSCPQYLLA